MNLLLTAGFMLAMMAAPSDAEGQNTPPKDDSETLCVPNRSPQRGTRRDGSRKPTIQCNLVRADPDRDRERTLRRDDGAAIGPSYASFDRSSGSPQ